MTYVYIYTYVQYIFRVNQSNLKYPEIMSSEAHLLDCCQFYFLDPRAPMKPMEHRPKPNSNLCKRVTTVQILGDPQPPAKFSHTIHIVHPLLPSYHLFPSRHGSQRVLLSQTAALEAAARG